MLLMLIASIPLLASKPRPLQDTFNDLLSNMPKPLGIHHIRAILFSLPVSYLKDLRDFADVNNIDSFVSKRIMQEFSVVIMKRFRSNRFEKTKGRHVFLIYRNLLEFITFVQSYFHYL
jgi:hypothetical protein